ncbi:hypothetical protein MPSEU_000911400 [Mayamaea pseudoterrestris]|nr:hypothetical protein MPSEU_000911400 [Mayamaea pseudoterrestris]
MSPINWLCIVRDETLLVQFPSPNSKTTNHSHYENRDRKHEGPNHSFTSIGSDTTVLETARGLLNREPSHGWDTFSTVKLWQHASHSKDLTALRGLRFHVYQRLRRNVDSDSSISSRVLVWVYACVYDSSILSKHQAQAFLEKTVLITELFRETDSTWQSSNDFEACQEDYVCLLEQRVLELQQACEFGNVASSLEYSKQIVQQNKCIIKEEKQRSQQILAAAAAAGPAAQATGSPQQVLELKERLAWSVGNLSSRFKAIPLPLDITWSGQASHPSSASSSANQTAEVSAFRATDKDDGQRHQEKCETNHDCHSPLPFASDSSQGCHDTPPNHKKSIGLTGYDSSNVCDAHDSPRDIATQCRQEQESCKTTGEAVAISPCATVGGTVRTDDGFEKVNGINKILFPHEDSHYDLDISAGQPKKFEAGSCDMESLVSHVDDGSTDSTDEPALSAVTTQAPISRPLVATKSSVMKQIGKDMDAEGLTTIGNVNRLNFNKVQPKVTSKEIEILPPSAQGNVAVKDDFQDLDFEMDQTMALYENNSVLLHHSGFELNASLICDDEFDVANSKWLVQQSVGGTMAIGDPLAIATATTVDSECDATIDSDTSVTQYATANDRDFDEAVGDMMNARHCSDTISSYTDLITDGSFDRCAAQSMRNSQTVSSKLSEVEEICDASSLPLPAMYQQTTDESASVARKTNETGITKASKDLGRYYEFVRSRSASDDRFAQLTTLAVIGAAVMFSKWPRGASS